MKPWPSGAKMNCPMEPAAVATPKAQERFSGGTRRPKAAATMENDAVPMPAPVNTPPVSVISVGVCEKAMRKMPSAYMMAPAINTRVVPNLSAKPPAMGWEMPHTRFWIAMAKPKTSRFQPWNSDSGWVNSPKVERVPKEMMATRQPATMMRAGL